MADGDAYKLEIVKGSTRPIVLDFLNEDDVTMSLTGATAATLAVKSSRDDSADVLLLRTADGNLAIDEAAGTLTGTISQVVADALDPGTYIANASVQFAAGWQPTDPFLVTVLDSVAPHST